MVQGNAAGGKPARTAHGANNSSGFKEVARLSLAQAPSVLEQLLPGGRFEGDEYVVINPTRKDNKPGSFKINWKTGVWSEFATGDSGNDLISLAAYIKHLSQGKAKDLISELIDLPGNGGHGGTKAPKASQIEDFSPTESVTPDLQTDIHGGTNQWVHPIPDYAPEPPTVHSKNGAPTERDAYFDESGQLCFYQNRFDVDGEKRFAPLSLWMTTDGIYEWQWKAPPAPRPIFGLDQLAQRPNDPVLVVEGEKATKAARRLLPEFVVITSLSGSNSAKKTDWSPLKGRDVAIWRDYDSAGERYAADVSKLIAEHASHVRILDLEHADIFRGRLKKGYDAADAESDIIETEALRAWVSSSAVKKVTSDLPFPFIRCGNSLCIKEDDDKPIVTICGIIDIMASTRDSENQNWGRFVRFHDSEGNLHEISIPMALLADGEEVIRLLLSHGLFISPTGTARKWVKVFLQQPKTDLFMRCVSQTGWVGKVFVLVDRTIGATSEPVIFQSEVQQQKTEVKGTLQDWQQLVAVPTKDNSRLIFALCCAFAAPLLKLLGTENGGFHLKGSSSLGKTTALRIANSVFSSPSGLASWRATANGLEAKASERNDLLLCLDEISQIDPVEAGQVAYMLANGSGKQRANRTGGGRTAHRFRLLFLSSGEHGLSQHMEVGNRKSQAGQEVRLLEVPADAGGGLGLFDTIHGADSPAEFANELQAACESSYGQAGIEYLTAIVADTEYAKAFVEQASKQFLQDVCAPGKEGQIYRAAQRFAVLSAAGELATQYGITGWERGEAQRAVKKCFDVWLANREGPAALEETRALAQVRQFIEMHGDSRFSKLNNFGDKDNIGRDTINRAGFTRQSSSGDTEFLVLPEVFKAEICKGFDLRFVTRLLIREGWVKPGADGRASKNERIPGFSQPKKVYVLTSKVLSDD